MIMERILLYICLLCLPCAAFAEQTLSAEQRQRVETAVKTYFERLARYAAEPMGAEAGQISFDISEMFENRLDAPVYNDLVALKDKTGIDASCTISDYLLSFGPLSEKYGYKFRITYDSIVCHPLVEPSNDNAMNALVYVRKHIEGNGVSETLTNVIRYNLNTDKLSYIEKSSFTTSDEDINFLLENHYGYSTAKLNEMAARCFQEKKYKQAYQLYEQAAIRDDMDAQYALANMLWKRQGCDEYGLFATINMTKFWLKKIYLKYVDNDAAVRLYKGLWEPVHQMMDIVFKNERTFKADFENEPFNLGLMKFKIPNKNSFGFINTKGEKVIPAIYEFAYAFSDGLASVQKNGKYGYINIKGEVVIPLQYEEASPFVNGTATVMYKDTINGKINRHFFMINKRGEKISEDFDNISWRTRKSEMIMMARRGNKWGAINGIGQIKIPFIYDAVKGRLPQHASVSDHFVSVSQDGKWGFINLASSENSVIVFPQYENVGVFSFGAAWVYDGQSYSFVDKTGSIICGGYVYCTPFNAMGLSCVKITMDTDEAYLINKKGEIVYYCSRDEKGGLYNLRRKE